MHSNRIAWIVLTAVLLLFFLQALSDFIAAIYAFGLLVTAFTVQLAAVLLLFSPIALMFVKRRPSRPWVMGLAAVAMIGRLVVPVLDPGGRLVASGVSVGAFLLQFPILLAAAFSRSTRASSRPQASFVTGITAAWGLLIAVMLSIFFRTAGSSLDISELGIAQLIAWALALFAARLIWRLEFGVAGNEPPDRGDEAAEIPGEPEERLQHLDTSPSIDTENEPRALTHEERRAKSLRALAESEKGAKGQTSPQRQPQRAPASASLARGDSSTARVVGLCVGLAAVIVMLYFAFVSPAVMARWTGVVEALVVLVLLLSLVLLANLLISPRWLAWLSWPLVLAWNGLFVLMLVLTLLPHQIAFPVTPDGYPFDAPAFTPLGQAPLYLMLLLSPVVFIDFLLYVQQLSAARPSLRQLGGGFALAALFFLVMVFFQVFTTIYDYARPIGPVLRDRFWLVYLTAGMGLALPVLLVRRASRLPTANAPAARAAFWAVSVLAIASTLAMALTTGRRPAAPDPTHGLRVMTYNIQQGFDQNGSPGLPRQLAAMQQIAPDVLGLQESDTARIANGNVDAVGYFANHLHMYSYYGPSTTVGTFGIALLSKYPIQNAQTFFMYSKGEQTACIHAEIVVNERTYDIFVTHLGNDGPLIQLENVLSRVQGNENVILMGDFNFDPTSIQYGMAIQKLWDAWLVRWPGGQKISGFAGEGRIDLVFVSPGTQVSDAHYVADGSSDHPYLYVVVQP